MRHPAHWSACAFILGLGGAVQAQQALYLKPAAFRLAPGEPLRVGLETAAKASPWDDAFVRWLFVRGDGTQENMDHAPAAPAAAPPGIPAAGVALPTPPPGAAAIGLDLKPRTEQVDAASLRAFAAKSCDDPLPEGVAGKITLTTIASCKALVRVGNGAGSPAAALGETGQNAEIIPRMDPTRAKVGSDLVIEAAIGGEDLDDARVFATCVATGKTQEFRAGEEGGGHFRVDSPGVWRVEFHHLVKAADGWTLTSATLVFEVPPEAKP